MSSSLKLIASTGMNAVFQELLPLYEAQTSNSVIVSYDSTNLILERIEAGETTDTLVLTCDALEALAKRELVVPKSIAKLAKSGVGMIVKAGAQHPDIATEAALRKTLELAKSVAHTTAGASGVYFMNLLQQLGIAEAVKAKAITQPGGRIAGLVSSGQAEIGVQLDSELVGMPGVEYVGPLPAAIQMEIIFAIGSFTSSAKSSLSEELINFLCRPEHAMVYRKNGMTPLGSFSTDAE